MKYRQEYRALHEAGKFKGFSVKSSLKEIERLVKETGAKTLLDYGCGKGLQYTEKQYHKRWGVLPALYDPGVKGLDTKPLGTFDGVICTDVLEHVPEEELDGVLSEIFGYANKFVVLSISTLPAKKFFKDGTNVHVTVKPESWWREKLPTKDILVSLTFRD